MHLGINNNDDDTNQPKPNLPKHLFWDCHYDKLDWELNRVFIIDRVIERGNKEQWREMINFYGEDNVINALKTEIKYLPDYIIEDVCSYFNLKFEELACYERKQLRRGHWI